MNNTLSILLTAAGRALSTPNAFLVWQVSTSVDLVLADRAEVLCFVGNGCQDEVVSRLHHMTPKKVSVVLDRSVKGLHADFFDSHRSARDESGGETDNDEEVEVLTLALPSRDACNVCGNLQRLIDLLFSHVTAKKDVIVGLSGGSLMNVTGLFASVSKRALRLACVPTSVGGFDS